MAEKGWTARIAAAAGAAAGTGAAQLGLGYGLGVVVWPVTPAADDSAWLGSLGWATWITASATVFGAVLGSRYRGGPGPRTSGSWRFALAACAAVGSLVTVALVALPARSAVRFDTFTPQVIAGGYAAIGLLLGLVVAFWAVSSRPVAANLMATGVWLWALAIAGIVVELALHRDSATYLTSWQFTEVANSGRFGAIYWPSALLTLGAAVLIGVLAAAPAARRGDLGTGAATSGVAGPLLVAFAFLALAPRLTGTLGPIESAYLIAPYAVLAGLAGSAVTIAAARARAARRPGAALTSVRLSTMTASTSNARADGDTPALSGADSSPSARRPKAATPADPSQPTPAALSAGPQPTTEPALTRDPRPTTKPAPPAVPQPTAKPAPSADPRPTTEPTATKRKLFGHSKVPAQAPAADTTPPPGPAPVVDAEIAAAARPRRPRPKKDTPPPAPPKPTVTPPPTAPKIAQINPKPSAPDQA